IRKGNGLRAQEKRRTLPKAGLMRSISLGQVLQLHRRIIEESGGTLGILNLGTLESALQQPRMTFGGEYLYPTLAEKAAALAFSIIRNHPFIDGNKRTGAAAG